MRFFHFCIFFLHCLFAIISCNNPLFHDQNFTSGLIEVVDNKNIHYLHFESRSDPDKDPLIFWFSGGYGINTMFSAFSSNGPFKLNEKKIFQYNNYSWNNKSNLIYVEILAGTGFSSSREIDMATNKQQVAIDFYNFLEQFLVLHPQYNNNKIYLTGELYAGYYIPVIAKYIVEKKSSLSNRLKGLLIISGFVSPIIQISGTFDSLRMRNLLKLDNITSVEKKCNVCRQQNNEFTAFYSCKQCEQAIISNITVSTSLEPYSNYMNGNYKILLCSYFKSPFIKRELNVEDKKFKITNKVWENLFDSYYFDASTDVDMLLNHEIKVSIVYGYNTILFDFKGGQKWVEEMNWSKDHQFDQKENDEFIVGSTLFGIEKQLLNLRFVVVFNSKENILIDMPQATNQILLDLIKD